jgi:acyl-CoA reductase-like NAD-dependent aldehyde dehydrogenase
VTEQPAVSGVDPTAARVEAAQAFLQAWQGIPASWRYRAMNAAGNDVEDALDALARTYEDGGTGR